MRVKSTTLLGVFVVLYFFSTVECYLPGVMPVAYSDNQPVPLKVNKLVSTKTQIPYSYYSLPFCEPVEGIKDMAENLGEILLGDKIENSPYLVSNKFIPIPNI